MRVTDFLHWQAALVRECAGAQPVRHHRLRRHDEARRERRGRRHRPRHRGRQHLPRHAGPLRRLLAVHCRRTSRRSLKHANFLVTETNAQTTDWSSASQFPPYDGQLREDVYTHLSNGANMVEYWHWASIAANQETYWKGVLSHDLEPNRAYAEVSRTAHELEKIGPHLVGLQIHNQVAILWSRDSANAIELHALRRCVRLAVDRRARRLRLARAAAAQLSLRPQHRLGLRLSRDTQDFSHYKLLIVPALYIADDALLQRISDYVKNGGHVVMTFKSGFANENSAVRWVRAPGPLREAAGFSYQEFSNLEHPLALKDDPFHAGAENKVSYWAEFLMPEHAKALAYYDHPFFGKWPAITENEFGAGTLLYEGTYLSDTLQTAVLRSDARKDRPHRSRPAIACVRSCAARRQPPWQAAALLLQLLRR